MSLFIFLMMLTRPIFQLSIIFTIPILVIFIIKQNFKKNFKIKFISILILSYFLSAGVQFMRYYNKTESISYSTQSGFQLIYWVIHVYLKNTVVVQEIWRFIVYLEKGMKMK